MYTKFFRKLYTFMYIQIASTVLKWSFSYTRKEDIVKRTSEISCIHFIHVIHEWIYTVSSYIANNRASYIMAILINNEYILYYPYSCRLG